MRCGVSGALKSPSRSVSCCCTFRPAQLSREALSFRSATPTGTQRFISSHPDPRCAKARNTCASAGLVIPDPATGTCLIHNVCHLASTIIIILATVRNVPQIVKCWRSNSAFGLSASALATEDATLLALVARLRGMRVPAMVAVCVGWLALKSVLFTELVPMWFLSKMQIFVGLILGLGARLPQILLNRTNGHTGNLALATYIFNSSANLVCCTSTAIITGDIYVMTKEVWMLALNATIVAQILATLKRQREAAAADLPPHGTATFKIHPLELAEIFRSRAPPLAGGLPEGEQRTAEGGDDGGNGRRTERVMGPPAWVLGSSSAPLGADVSSRSMDGADSPSGDPKIDNNGSMDGMQPSLA